MLADREPRRVLIVAAPTPDRPLDRLFGTGPLAGWEAVLADSFAAARFVLQHGPCDILLVDELLYHHEDAEAFDWLARRHQLPVVVLTGPEGAAALQAQEDGVRVWLPCGPEAPEPQLLAAALDQAVRLGALERDHRQLEGALDQSRRQVDRLVSLLWRTLPLDAERRWLSQRHVLERLQEELSRARRYGNPLTVALGAMRAPGAGDGSAEALPDWAAERILRGKRGCDVAGQYGPHGFLLLLVNTPPDGALVCCRRLQRALEQAAPGPDGLVRSYFGLAAASADAATAQGLLRRAEEHLEAAKEDGQARLVAG